MRKRTEFPIGEKFGKLTVQAVHRDKGNRYWRATVQCDCGSDPKDVALHHVERGATVSCGCAHKAAITKHGHCVGKAEDGNSRTYERWKSMKSRTSENSRARRWYFDRGITVCLRWADDRRGFHNFLDDMGECPEGLELDRIDNDKGYSPENCRWVTKSEQVRNRRYKRENSPYRNVFPWGRNGWKWGIMFGGEKAISGELYNSPEEAALGFNRMAQNIGADLIKEVIN